MLIDSEKLKDKICGDLYYAKKASGKGCKEKEMAVRICTLEQFLGDIQILEEERKCTEKEIGRRRMTVERIKEKIRQEADDSISKTLNYIDTHEWHYVEMSKCAYDLYRKLLKWINEEEQNEN